MAATGPLDWAWIALAVPAVLAFGWSVLQVQHDAAARGLPHRLVLLLVIVTWPVGVLLYWLAKPTWSAAQTDGGVQ